MAKTYEQIKAEAQAISGASGKGSITKGMVGGAILDSLDFTKAKEVDIKKGVDAKNILNGSVVSDAWQDLGIITYGKIGEVIDINSTTGSPNYIHQVLDVTEGDVVSVRGYAVGQYSHYAILNENNILVRRENNYVDDVRDVSTRILKGESKIILCVSKSREYSDVTISRTSITDSIKELNEKVEGSAIYINGKEVTYGAWEEKGINTFVNIGEVVNLNSTDGSTSFIHQVIEVTEGEIVYVRGYIGGGSYKLYTLLDSENRRVGEQNPYADDVAEYNINIPSGVSKILVNAYKQRDYSPVVVKVIGKKSDIDAITKNQWKGKRLLAIGDSVTANNKTKWQYHVGKILDMEVSTHAQGGIGIIKMVDGDGSGNSPSGFDQNTDVSGTLPALTSNDVENVDVIICHGFYNEIRTPLGEVNDMYNPSDKSGATLCGELNYMIKRIYQCIEQSGNYTCKIVLSSAHRFGKNQYTDDDAYVHGDEFADAVKMVAEHNSVGYIDNMHYANFNKYNWSHFHASSIPYNPLYITGDGTENDGKNKPFASTQSLPSSVAVGSLATVGNDSYEYDGSTWKKNGMLAPWNADQLHTNEEGSKRIGEYIAGCLRAMFPNM